MRKAITIALSVALALPLPALASAAPSTALGTAAPAAAAAATADTDTPHGTNAAAASAKETITMAPIVVSVPRPHIWTFQKGNSKVLVLGTVYPEPEGISFIPGSIHHAIAQSGAIIGPPWFSLGVRISVFQVFSMWHATSGAMKLPDDKHLADVLSPTELQQWTALKARYLPFNFSVNRLRPMFAGWKLYEAVIKHSGVAGDAAVPDLIKSDAKKRGIPTIDATFHWTVKDPIAAAHAFVPSQEADMACFRSIIGGIEGVPESARTLAKAWAIGDVTTMQTYLSNHTITPPCWSSVIDDAVAIQQGLHREQEERKAWLAALHSATGKYPIVFTTAPVQFIFKPTAQIQWMLEDGYTMVPDDDTPQAAVVPAAGSAVSSP